MYVDDKQHSKIFYCELPTIKIQSLINDAQKQKTKTIRLIPFPEENNKKENLLFNFFETRRRQASFDFTKPLMLEELKSQGVLEELFIPVSRFGLEKFDPAHFITTSEVYIYAKIRGSPIEHPLGIIPSHLVASQVFECPVSVNNNVFYTQVSRIVSAEEDVIKIGESFKVDLDQNKKNNGKIHYTAAKTLGHRIRDLRFIVNAIEAKSFSIGETIFQFDPTKDKFDLSEKKEGLEFFEKILQVLEILNVHEDLDLSKMTNEEILFFSRLITAFIDKQPVWGLNPQKLKPVTRLIISSLRLFLAFIPYKDNSEAFYIYDFFKMDFGMVDRDLDGKDHPVSQYAILKSDDFMSASNIRYEVLLPSFKEMEDKSYAFERGNWFLLDLLTAYDKSNKPELLLTAKEFSEWLSNEADNGNFDKQISVLNHFQIIKRERNLNSNEVAALCSIIENGGSREDILCGAYLLLDNQKAAEIHFNRLDEERQKSFETFPIYKFWKGTVMN